VGWVLHGKYHAPGSDEETVQHCLVLCSIVQVYFAGVVWAGFETPDRMVQGLYKRTIGSHLDQMKKLGFSVIRLPFSGEALQKASRPRNFNAYANPKLKVTPCLGTCCMLFNSIDTSLSLIQQSSGTSVSTPTPSSR